MLPQEHRDCSLVRLPLSNAKHPCFQIRFGCIQSQVVQRQKHDRGDSTERAYCRQRTSGFEQGETNMRPSFRRDRRARIGRQMSPPVVQAPTAKARSHERPSNRRRRNLVAMDLKNLVECQECGVHLARFRSAVPYCRFVASNSASNFARRSASRTGADHQRPATGRYFERRLRIDLKLIEYSVIDYQRPAVTMPYKSFDHSPLLPMIRCPFNVSGGRHAFPYKASFRRPHCEDFRHVHRCPQEPDDHRRPRPRPNRAMLRAVGFHDDDFDRPMIGVASLFSDITPCNAHLDRLARKALRGHPRRRRRAADLRRPDRVRRHHDGPPGHALQPRVARGHRRQPRSRRRRHEPRRPARLRRLRQEHARLRHGDGPAEHPERLRLRRQHPARHRRRTARTSTSSPSSRRSASSRPASSTTKRRAQDRVRGVPRRRLVRRHVHRQHHEFSAIEAMGMSLPYDASYPAVSAAKEREAFLAGQGAGRADREEHPAARHHHAQVAGERLHAGAGPGRLDQRRAAPDGHRPRGRGRVDAGRLRPPRRRRCRTWPT